MHLIREVASDFNIIVDILLHEARREYRFSGPNGPVIGINGAGFSGWPLSGQRSLMTELNCSGVLMSLDYLNTDLPMCLRRLDKEIIKYKNATLVGHSVGGLLALEWARINGWQKINKIITVGSPLGGSSKLFGFAGNIVREMVKGSLRLNDILSMHPPENSVVSVFAGRDKFAQRPENIKTNWDSKIKYEFEAHGDIINNKAAYEKELKEAIGL